jgi:hypothetical protein
VRVYMVHTHRTAVRLPRFRATFWVDSLL